MMAASWTWRVSRSLGVQNDSRRPVPMRIHLAQTRTVWPDARSSDRMVPTKESSPRLFAVGVGAVGGVWDVSAFASLTTGFHSWETPSQYHLPSGDTRGLPGFDWVVLMTCLLPPT